VSTIVIYTSGTLGDHLPFFALGQALTARGHRVRMAINQAMHPYAHRAGLEAIALTDIERGPEQARENAWAWDHWRTAELAAHPKAKPFDVERYITQARELVDLCRHADLLISTSIRTLGYVVYSVLRLPWLTVSVNPFIFWQPVPAEEREVLRANRLKEYNVLKDLIAYAFAELGVDKTPPAWSGGWLFARHVILASSPHFSRPSLNQLQPHSSIDMTGFWFYEDPAWQDWQPDQVLRRFCQRRPIVLSFSSQPLEDPRRALALHVEAAARLGRPLLVQHGWAGFSEDDLPPGADPENTVFADFMPHDWLFTQAACAIQHGGIGSIARALRQGCPLLIEPYGNDQLYNTSRVVGLGVGAAMHPFKMTVDGLVHVLSEKVLTPGYRQRAEEVGAIVRAENGLEIACHLIETYLAQQRSGDRSTWQVPYTVDRKDRAIAFPQRPPLEGYQLSIPRILHQTWKDTNVPPALAMFQRTWQTHHPDWTYHLWTDADNREFLRKHYPWFLPIYDNYPEHIMRVDAVRYFILHHYGGVYADLDVECLRPLDLLLAGKQVVFGLEHPAHLELPLARQRSLRRIIGNALMASVHQHPLWEHVFKQLVAYHRAPGPLDATGPFLLTRAYDSFAHQETISLEPAELLYPISNDKSWQELAPEVQTRIGQTAYTIHHWQGGWWREAVARQAQQIKTSLLARGEVVNVSAMVMNQCLALSQKISDFPLVSCLMVTKNRADLAQRSVRCFQQQTYPNKELVIVDDGEDDSLGQWVDRVDNERITHVRLPAENRSLGELRNIAVERATGEYVAQWDDDDLSDPRRLEIQLAAIRVLQTDACFLERHQIWWPDGRRLALSCRRIWESSFVCAKAKLPPYPALRQGEDTPVIGQVVAEGRVAVLDLPQLYAYVFHGANTFAAEHWEEHWLGATELYEGDMYDIMIQELQNRLQLDLSPWIGQKPAAAAPASGGEASQDSTVVTHEGTFSPKEGQLLAPSPSTAGLQTETTGAPPSGTAFPKVLILTPVKDAVRFLPRYWEKLKALTYPHDRISVAFLESDSIDGTYTFIEENLPALQAEFAKAKLFKRDFAYRSALPRWEPSQQLKRRSIMAKSRNHLLAQALEGEDWVLWTDVDVARWPNDVIEQLLVSGKDIVVPNCLSVSTGETFDYNTFKLKPSAENLDWSPYIVDGILQPPKGYGRLYLSDLRQYDCAEVDAVGGTMLLIRADVHREGLVFPTFSYKFHIETEGLALMAKDMGYRCWGLPNLEIFHP